MVSFLFLNVIAEKQANLIVHRLDVVHGYVRQGRRQGFYLVHGGLSVVGKGGDDDGEGLGQGRYLGGAVSYW